MQGLEGPVTHRARDCDELGLTDDQHAALTGFSGRAVRALAHLREAWCGADPQNRECVARAIRALLAAHSLQDIPRATARVLTCGLDDGRAVEILEAVLRGDSTAARWRSGEPRS